MRFKIVFFSLLALILTGCSQKDVTYLKNHPQEIFDDPMACATLNSSELLKDKTCLAIAQLEKAPCEQELRNNGVIRLPNGLYGDCNDTAYLVARPILDAQMEAVLEGKPDPVAQYRLLHNKKSSM